MSFKIWFRAMRVPFLSATLVPVMLGSVIAWHQGARFNWTYFWLTLIGVSFIHIGTNMANDYFDHRSKNDWVNKTPTPFSGGSRVIQDGLISPRRVLYFALTCFAAGAIIGLYLNWRLKTNVVLLLGIIGVLCGLFYTAPPFKIGYRRIGELVVGFCFGPLVVIGAYYVQTQGFSLIPFWASIPVGILITLVLYINEFPDYEADKSVNKKTLIVILGKKRAIRIYHSLLILTYIFIILGALLRSLPIYVLITLITLPLTWKAFLISKNNYTKVPELLPVNSITISLHLLIGLLLSGGFLIDRIWR